MKGAFLWKYLKYHQSLILVKLLEQLPIFFVKKELLKCPVEQIDETTWRVVVWPKDNNGEPEKKNGSLGWVWVHNTSELIKGHKISKAIKLSFTNSQRRVERITCGDIC